MESKDLSLGEGYLVRHVIALAIAAFGFLLVALGMTWGLALGLLAGLLFQLWGIR